jgi:zinc/manganese transport system substrate-binding protein
VFWSRLRHRVALILALVLTLPGLARGAGSQVVATTASLAALAREVAGAAAQVTVLAPPGRDLRTLEVKPAMVQALRSADLVLVLGSGQEDGWLPRVLAEASNPGVLPGQPGHFDASKVPSRNLPAARAGAAAAADLTGVLPRADLDPVRMGDIGSALGTRLGILDGVHAALYTERANGFAAKLLRRMPQWQRLTAKSAGVVLYDSDPLALLDRLAVPLLGTLCPAPGLAPTGAHLSDLLEALKHTQGLILYPVYTDPKAARLVAGRLGWEAIALPLDPPTDADGDAYLDHITRWVEALGKIQVAPGAADPAAIKRPVNAPATGPGKASESKE